MNVDVVSASEREANKTAMRALELSLRYNFVTELTSLIVVADDNFTIDDGQNANLALDESLAFFARPLPSGSAGVVRKSSICLLYTSPSPRDATLSRMPSSA